MHPRFTTIGQVRPRSTLKRLNHAIEALENRVMLTLAQDNGGWTVFNTPTTGQIIYVDNGTSGSGPVYQATDTNNPGTDYTHPLKTLAAAKSKVVTGKDYWVLLRRGDTWNESFGTWTAGGKDANHPMLIGSYGFYNDPISGDTTEFDPSSFPDDPGDLNLPARPVVNAQAKDSNGQATPADGIMFLGSTTNHIAVDGISFTCTVYNGTNSTGATGLRAQLTATDYLVEDCSFKAFKDDVTVGNPSTPVNGFTLRRCEVLDAYNHAGAHAQGMYVSGSCSNITIEQNTFDHNGWVVASDKVVFNHDMYINTGAQNVLVDGNTITRGSLRGTLLRAGGTVLNNFYDQNSVAIQVGNTASVVKGNVILEGVDQPTLPSGVGIDVAFSMPSVDIENNIVAHDQSSYEYNLSGINLNTGTHNATVLNNIVYDWRNTLINGTNGGTNQIQDNVLEDFDGYHALINKSSTGSTTYGDGTEAGDITGAKGNIYYTGGDPAKAFQEGSTKESYSTWLSHNPSDSTSTFGTLANFIDPNRDMGSYNKTLGGNATFNDWIAAQRAQTRDNGWYAPTLDGSLAPYTAAAENKYISDGFSDGTNVGTTAQKVTVTASDAVASEVGPDTGTFTITRTGTIAQLALPLTFSYDLTGSATLNTDYTVSPSTISFPANTHGETTQSITVTVTPSVDAKTEGDETVKFSVLSAGGSNPLYIPGATSSAIITISDLVPQINVFATIDSASVTGPVPGDFTITRSGPTTSPLTVSVLLSGEATYLTDYTLSADAAVGLNFTAQGADEQIGTITFAAGASSDPDASSIDITLTPIDTGVLHGPPDDSGNPTSGDQSVGLTVEPTSVTPPPYAVGVSSGATITIFDGTAPPTLPGGGGGGGGNINPPPLGHGLYEAYYNAQDNFIPTSEFTSANTSDVLTNNIKNGAYGTTVFSEVDSRPGFSFTGAPHPGVNATHFTTVWAGQFQPQYEQTYTLYLTLDGDASARVYVQDDTGQWKLVTTTNDTDPTQPHFTHMMGDATDDAVVDSSDFTALAANFGSQTAGWNAGDFNFDGTVNALDFNALASNYGKPDTRTSPNTVSGTIGLSAGVRYNVVVEYSQKVGVAQSRFLWSSTSRPYQEVPLDRLYASSAATGSALGSLVAASGSSLSDLFSSKSIDGSSDPLVLP